MRRREFLKTALATAAMGAVAPKALLAEPVYTIGVDMSMTSSCFVMKYRQPGLSLMFAHREIFLPKNRELIEAVHRRLFPVDTEVRSELS
jgi:hypothetical protein